MEWQGLVPSELFRRATELTLNDVINMPENTKAILLFSNNSITGLTSREAVKAALHRHVHINTLNTWPTSLSRLNRIYGRVACKHETSSRELADELINEGKLTPFTREGKTGLVATSLWTELPEVLSMQGIEQGSGMYEDVMYRWAANTVK